jgi:hypothetical protein
MSARSAIRDLLSRGEVDEVDGGGDHYDVMRAREEERLLERQNLRSNVLPHPGLKKAVKRRAARLR